MNFPTLEQYIQFTVFAVIAYSLGITLIIVVAAKICFAYNIHRVANNAEDVMKILLCPDAVSYDSLREYAAERTRKLELALVTMRNTSGILQMFYELKPEEQKLAATHDLNRAVTSQEAAINALVKEDYESMLKHSVKAFLAIERVQAALWYEHKVFCLLKGQEMPTMANT
jgi:hypothetical protein